MADKPSSKSERIEAPEVVAPKKSVETSSDVIEKGPKAVIARLKSVKSLESAVLVKRKARSGKTVDKTGKMGHIESKTLKIKRSENYLKKLV